MNDLVKVLVELTSNPRAVGNVLNIGNEQEASIEDLAKSIIEITRSSSSVKYIPLRA